MSFFDVNKKILLNQYPGLFEEINAKSDCDLTLEDIKVETTPAGEPALCVKGIYVHSPRDPVREAQRLVQAQNTGAGPFVILGFGLGYAAQAAAGLGRPVIIVEKYGNLLLKAMELRDFSEFLSNKNIIFIIGGAGDGIMNALAIASELAAAGESDNESAQKTSDEKLLSIIANRTLTGLDEEWYKNIEDKIRTWTMKDEVNTATLKRFGKRWVRNLSRNMNAIRDYPGISRLAGLASKDNPLPVFLAAAGPSLDKIGPLLRSIHNRCITVAVDTSLRFFNRNGVQPDFVLVVDPQFWNSRHLDRCIFQYGSSKTVLIAESAVYPPVLHLPFRKIFLCSSLFPLGSFIEKQVDPKGKLGAGGSVTTTAWDFARSLGAQDIWIAGLDLAFPGLKTHFRGARFEEKANSVSCRLNPVETWVVRALRDGSPFRARSSAGGQVLTDRRLSLYAAWFENQFSKYGQIRNYCLFQEGLAIAGLEGANAETLLTLPERREEIDRRIETAFSKTEAEFNEPEETGKRSQRYVNAVSVLIGGLESIKNAAEEGAVVAKNALKRNLKPYQQDKIVKDLDEITQRIANSEVKEVAGFLFPPVEKEEDKDVFRAYLKSSLKLFSSLAEAAAFNLKYHRT